MKTVCTANFALGPSIFSSASSSAGRFSCAATFSQSIRRDQTWWRAVIVHARARRTFPRSGESDGSGWRAKRWLNYHHSFIISMDVRLVAGRSLWSGEPVSFKYKTGCNHQLPHPKNTVVLLAHTAAPLAAYLVAVRNWFFLRNKFTQRVYHDSINY